MIDMALVLGLIATLYFIATVELAHRYCKTKYMPTLPFAVTAFFLALAAVFGVLIAAATSVNNLPLTKLFYRFSTTSEALGFVFLNIFAIAWTNPDEKMRGTWMSVASFLAITFIV
ncbi:MAG: hypothetical protein AOA66_1180 [Candidatus Bathyarchaeota archaeon BA2]|nr:MAG: hypothetical protein AOA66_1180 [Candidatus Bathyarchaeota archaeon BA2]